METDCFSALQTVAGRKKTKVKAVGGKLRHSDGPAVLGNGRPWREAGCECFCVFWVLLTRSLSELPLLPLQSSCSSKSSQPPARAAARWWRRTSSPQTRWMPVPWWLQRQRGRYGQIYCICVLMERGFDLTCTMKRIRAIQLFKLFKS